MLLYNTRTAAVAGDRKPSALKRSGNSPATGGTAANADRHSPWASPWDVGTTAEVPRDAPGTAGSSVNAAGPHRRMAWRKTAKESARTDKLQQRPAPSRHVGEPSRGGRGLSGGCRGGCGQRRAPIRALGYAPPPGDPGTGAGG
jgi:hypothetical protein